MRRSKKTQFAAVRFAILISALTLTGVHSAYAQSSTPDKAVARMLIAGIPGDIHDGTIEVVGINQQLTNPAPSGGTNSPPAFSLTVTKKIDRATPRLFIVGVSGELLRQVKITWTKLNPTTNQEEFSHSITLEGVLVTLVRQRPANSAEPEARQSDEYEDVTFSLGSSAGTPAGRVVWEYALPGGRTIVRTGWDFGTGRQN